MDYSSLSLEETEQILRNPCTKQQLIDIGYDRFGIPKSKISNVSKRIALEYVASALENELTFRFWRYT